MMRKTLAYFTPGPTAITKKIQEGFVSYLYSHRSPEFKNLFFSLQGQLCALTKAKKVNILTGSGTLANTIIAVHLAGLNTKGLILSNGEFGERLLGHAKSCSLDHVRLSKVWGEPFYQQEVENILIKEKDIKWVWCTHCETSTGMLNDVDMLKAICQQYDLKLCLDCISSIGCVPVDLQNVYLASATSNKGMCSYPGVALVFANGELPSSSTRIPGYLDLNEYSSKSGIPYTISSNLTMALFKSIKEIDTKSKFSILKKISDYIVQSLIANKISLVLSKVEYLFNIITIQLPLNIVSISIGDALKKAGFYLNYESDYLISRNWIQICIMSDIKMATVKSMLKAFYRLVEREKEFVK